MTAQCQQKTHHAVICRYLLIILPSRSSEETSPESLKRPMQCQRWALIWPHANKSARAFCDAYLGADRRALPLQWHKGDKVMALTYYFMPAFAEGTAALCLCSSLEFVASDITGRQ